MHRWFSKVCTKYADQVLVRPSFTYKDLLKLSQEKKVEYIGKNIQKGDRVVISEYNSINFLGKLNALWSLHATPCLISPKIHSDKRVQYEKMLMQSKIDVDTSPEALLMLTSGTSSTNPKGVRLSHSNLTNHTEILREHIPNRMFGSSDRTLSFLPWTHCYGLMGECFSVMDRGASMSILSTRAQQQFGFPTFFKDIQLCQPTILFVVPYLLEVIAKRDEQLRKLITNRSMRRSFWFGNHIRYIVSGGAYLKPEIRQAFWNYLDIEIIQGYGCSEMSPMVSLQTNFQPRDLSVGEILPTIQVDIRDNEVWVNGPNRFLGYVGEEQLSCSEFYNTKDTGYVKNNKLYLTGRSSNIVKLSNGKFVDIQNIENMLIELIPYCRTACVWKGDDQRLYGIAHVVDIPYSVDIADGKTAYYKCFEEDIEITLCKTSFLSPTDGTLTIKGEMCRPIIRSLYEKRNCILKRN
jgi:long-subunit acyl-CoA synthetase (AMP-forming)